MERQKKSLTLELTPAACMLLAVAVLFVPLRWVICWLTAAAVHELCHYGMILLTGGRIHHIRIGMGGAVMQTQLGSWGKEILCAAAGPAGGLLLLLFVRWMPRLALCAFVQSLCNLVPVYPLDGGRIFEGLLRYLLPRRADQIIKWATSFMLLLICGACIYAMLFLDLGVFPVIFALSILLHTGKIKIPCKAGPLGVQ